MNLAYSTFGAHIARGARLGQARSAAARLRGGDMRRGPRILLVFLLVGATATLAACSSDSKGSGSSNGNGSVDLGGKVNDKGTTTASGSSLEVEADDFY